MSMRYCIKDYRTSIDPHLLRTFFSHTKISITNYNWIFSDLTAYTSKGDQELEESIFCQDNFILTGQELDELLKNEEVVVIFGVMVAVKENLNIKDIEQLPVIEYNEHYWEEDYVSPIKNAVMEIGFFDGELIVVTTDDQSVVETLKRNVFNFPNLISFKEYLES
ncbi:DUF2691 family protein [Priestia endophytica]|uniref:DUF2691 family protein n=1 Tax=Priestia endophytica TaxID=135735 RepID=UPI002E1C87CC|nr:DUF2691 family protein [Priestia endophytica]